ncbi:MAG TPA: hypothetical protein VIU46_03205 [Gallionellaceae bacterium]
MAAVKWGVAVAAMLLLAGCGDPILTPKSMRDYAKEHDNGWVKIETYVVNRPYAAVTQSLQRKSNECLNKTFGVTISRKCGFVGTCESDGGTNRYIPVANIGAAKSEFYTKFWSSGGTDHKDPGDRTLLYLADVTPKGNGTQIKMYYFDFDRYQWTRDSIKGWASGEDIGCPLLSGSY